MRGRGPPLDCEATGTVVGLKRLRRTAQKGIKHPQVPLICLLFITKNHRIL